MAVSMNGIDLKKHYESVIKSKEELIVWYEKNYYSVSKAIHICNVIEKEIKHIKKLKKALKEK